MLASLRQYAFETFRCTKHNFADLRMFRVHYRRGRWHVHTPEGAVLNFPYYPYLAFYEIEGYLRQGLWRLAPGQVVVDAGGCFGEFALYASTVVGPTGRVIMLEPDEANIARMHEILALNGGLPANLTISTDGLWNQSGTIEFAAGLGSASGVVGVTQAEVATASQPATHTLKIQAESLASLMAKHHLPRLDFVKLDIEGAEIEVVQGGADVLHRYRPRLAIATYHLRDGKPTSVDLEPRLRSLGYNALTGFPTHQTTYGWPADAAPDAPSKA